MTQQLRQRRTWRGRDYTGAYVRKVQPASWQEKLDLLHQSLSNARSNGDARMIPIVERAIAQHRTTDPIAHDRSLGLIP